MPERKLRNIKEEKPTITLRRSPRFLHANRTNEEEDLRTPEVALAKARCPGLTVTPPGSFVNKSLRKCEISSTEWSKISENSRRGSRRSAGLGREADAGKNEAVDLQMGFCIEKRVTRSSVRQSKNVDNRASVCASGQDSGAKGRVLLKEGKSKVGSRLSERCLGRLENRITRSSSRSIVAEKVEKAKDASKNSRSDDTKCCLKRRSGDENCPRKTRIGKKRKREKIGGAFEIVQGWTKEQELALRRAYFIAKPTPHFWKKVARMVPGKSAKECLNKIHSEHLTPRQPRTRSRANRNEPSLLSFSASKLLNPTETKTKNLKLNKKKGLLAQKTVRLLLQKQQKEDQDYEADLFAVLESTAKSLPLNFLGSSAFSSPIPNVGPGILARSRETSSLAPKKHFSRSNSSVKTDFASPPVLKQIKNKALHERYIDQLHCRDAKRKAESLRSGKLVRVKKDKHSSRHVSANLVKVAKDALVFKAQDAINQFRTLQSNLSFDNADDNSKDSDECDDEDEL